MKTLVLGETVEAADLAGRLARDLPAVRPTLAVDARRARCLGEIADAALPRQVALRGGVSGAEGLVTAVKWDRFQALVDASHPFDAPTRAAAVNVARALGLPLLQLHRPLWSVDNAEIADTAAAAAAHAPFNARLFLWIGAERLDPFLRRPDLWTLSRVYDPPPGRYPTRRGDFAVGRGPFTPAHERTLLADYRIAGVVLDNIGGRLGASMLAAVRDLALPLTLVTAPTAPTPPVGGARVETVSAAVSWLSQRLSRWI